MAKPSTPESFWARVDKTDADGCWPYKGRVEGFGYGRVDYRGKGLLAHRLAFELTHGSLTNDACVLHSCDNPPCCNPAHLRLGTRKDNAIDRKVRARHWRDRRPESSWFRGENSANARLSAADVLEIVALRRRGIWCNVIAAQFGVSKATVSDIALGRRWNEVTGIQKTHVRRRYNASRSRPSTPA